MRGMLIGLASAMAVVGLVLGSAPRFGRCLGPLEGTQISCIQATGIFPDMTLSLFHAASLGLAFLALWLAPGRLRTKVSVGLFGVAAIPVGALTWTLIRQREIEGWRWAPSFDPNEWVVLQWPFHLGTAIIWGVVLAVLVLAFSALLLELRALHADT